LRLPRFGGAIYAVDFDNRSRYRQAGLGVSDRTEFFNNIDPKLTLECALISLSELIDDLEFAVRKPLALPAFPTAVN